MTSNKAQRKEICGFIMYVNEELIDLSKTFIASKSTQSQIFIFYMLNIKFVLLYTNSNSVLKKLKKKKKTDVISVKKR